MELARERAKDAETEGTATDDMAAEITAQAAAAVETATTTESGPAAARWVGWEEQLGASGSSGAEWSGAEAEE